MMACLSVSETTDQISDRGKHTEPNYLMNTTFFFFGSSHGEKDFVMSLKSGCFTQDRVTNASRNEETLKHRLCHAIRKFPSIVIFYVAKITQSTVTEILYGVNLCSKWRTIISLFLKFIFSGACVITHALCINKK